MQIGCGRWGRNILRDLRSLGVEVVVVDPDPAARSHAEQQGATTFERVPQAPAGVSGYVVAAPTSLHADLIDPLLATGLPIYCEKPLTDSLARARDLAKHCPARNLFVMEKWRYHPGVRALREIAVSGELGAVRGLHCTRVQWNHSHRDVDATWILAPHDLSIAQSILGRVPEPRIAVAEGVREAGEGMIAVFGEDPWFVMEISTIREQTRREIRLVCEHGVALIDDPLADHIKVVRTGDPDAPFAPELRPIPTEMPLLLELKAFVGYLDGGPEPLCGLDEAVASVECITRLRRLAGIPDV